MRLLRKAELIKARYSKESRKVLVILSAKRGAAGEIRRISGERNIKLVIGRY